ncbi:MAG TPA: CGNR zinc finger domain-containing protein [Solirubrobacteraceae bacterium]|jgi:predicted RNA-binding Zn ribbon-like protein
MAATTEIPLNLDLVIDFVNTVDPDVPSDSLETVDGLADWLTERGLLDAGETALTDSDRQEAIALREALRAVMLANNGEPPDPVAPGQLELAAKRGELGVHFETGTAVELRPGVGGLPGALARLLVPVADGVRDGSWTRVKACPGDGCQWAFYDHSRNRSARWCEMAVCGNRTKVRAYRARSAQ